MLFTYSTNPTLKATETDFGPLTLAARFGGFAL